MNKRQKEVIQAQLTEEQKVIKQLEQHYRLALDDVEMVIRLLQSDEQTPSKIRRVAYQQKLKTQLEAILDRMRLGEYKTLQEYLTGCYTSGYVGTMYDIHGQGVPVIAPINQDAAAKAIQLDTQLSTRKVHKSANGEMMALYESLGIDTDSLKKTIRSEITRGIANGSTYDIIARNIANVSKAPLARAKTIARTEGHRIMQQSAEDARLEAQKHGADVVRQWDATLDGDTRSAHRELDGQIVEMDEYFHYGTKKAKYPGGFGDPGLDCNCRCVALTRARRSLDEKELETLKKRAEVFGLDKTEDFNEFRKKYLRASEAEESVAYTESERITKSVQYAVDPKMLQSRSYAEKFDSMAMDKQERREFLKAAKEILQHRSGQNGEDLYLYNRETKRWYRSTAGNEAGTPEYTQAIIDAITKSKPNQIVAFHNHPASMPPSDGDLNAAKQNGYSEGYILCHDGKIFEYTAPSRPIRSTAYDLIIANFKEKGYNEYEAQVETLKALSAEYGFSFKEVK